MISQDDDIPSPPRAEYKIPVLRAYGNLMRQARGTGGTRGDGQAGMTRMG